MFLLSSVTGFFDRYLSELETAGSFISEIRLKMRNYECWMRMQNSMCVETRYKQHFSDSCFRMERKKLSIFDFSYF